MYRRCAEIEKLKFTIIRRHERRALLFLAFLLQFGKEAGDIAGGENAVAVCLLTKEITERFLEIVDA